MLIFRDSGDTVPTADSSLTNLIDCKGLIYFDLVPVSDQIHWQFDNLLSAKLTQTIKQTHFQGPFKTGNPEVFFYYY